MCAMQQPGAAQPAPFQSSKADVSKSRLMPPICVNWGDNVNPESSRVSVVALGISCGKDAFPDLTHDMARAERLARKRAKVPQEPGRNAKRPMHVHRPLALTVGQQHFATVQKGSPGRTRTCDKAVNSRLLYQLSYRGFRWDKSSSRGPRSLLS